MILTSDLVDQLGTIKAQQSLLAKEEKELKAKLMPMLKAEGCEAVEGDFFRCTLSEMERRTLDKKAVAALLSKPKFEACFKVGYSERININAHSKEG